MIEYAADKKIKFAFNPQVNKRAFQINQVGAQEATVIDEADFDYTDDNSVFVSKAGNDSTGSGTQAAPYLTIAKAIDETTEDKTFVIVIGNDLFSEDLSSCTFDYSQGVYAGTGYSPTLSLRKLSVTPTNSNRIFFSKDGDDDTGDGTMEHPVLTIAKAATLCDASHQICHCLDSETYEEEAFEFTGNFLGLEAAEGETPTLSVIYDESDAYSHFSFSKGSDTLLSSNGNMAEVIKISDSRVIVIYVVGSSGVYYKVYDNEMGYVSGPTTLNSGNTSYVSACLLSTGLIFMIYWRSADNNFVYRVIDATTFADVVGETVFLNTSYPGRTRCIELPNGNIFLTWGTGSTIARYYAVWDAQYQVVKSASSFSAIPDILHVDLTLMDENTLLAVFTYGAFSEIRFAKFDTEDYSILDSGVFLSPGDVSWVTVTKLLNDLLFVCYDRYVPPQTAFYTIIDYSGNVIQPETTYSSYCAPLSNDLLVTGDVVTVVMDYLGALDAYFSILSITYNAIEADVNISIDGFTLKPSDVDYLKRFINSDSDIVLRHVDLIDCIAGQDLRDAVPIITTGAFQCNNSRIFDCDSGPQITNNSVEISDSQIYRITSGFAIEIDGAGSGIIIEHNDIFNNYGAIYLENNDGDEVIKNNIIHDNDNGTVAETSVDCDYSVVTDDNTNLAVGTKFVRANPLYIDEGYVNPANLDLNIKTRIAGYQTDSPAYGLADDARNAGAIDVKYIGEETTYTEITVTKPMKILPRLAAVAPAFNQRRSGDVASSKEGQSLFVVMEWDVVNNDDTDLLEQLWCCDQSDVNIYFQPITYPDQYESFKLKYDDMDQGIDVFTLSDLGVDKIKMTFARAYER